MTTRQSTYIAARRPGFYLWLAGLTAVTIVVMLLAVLNRWWAFIPLGGAVVLGLAYLLVAPRWYGRQLRDDLSVADRLWQQAGLQTDAHIVVLSAGLRGTAVYLGRRLATGRMQAIDLYHPQQMPDPILAAWRGARATSPPETDPRMEWLEGRIDLVPLPDGSSDVVFFDQVLSELRAAGDRELVLQEVRRILRPGGQLYFVERVRQPAAGWVVGVDMRALDSAESVQSLLRAAGFQPAPPQPLSAVLVLFTAATPTERVAKQLRFDF